MKVNDFISDIRTMRNMRPEANKVIKAYERGLLTFHQCLRELYRIEDKAWRDWNDWNCE